MVGVDWVVRGVFVLAALGLLFGGWFVERVSRSLTVVVLRARLIGWCAVLGRALCRVVVVLRLRRRCSERCDDPDPVTVVFALVDPEATDLVPALVRPYVAARLMAGRGPAVPRPRRASA